VLRDFHLEQNNTLTECFDKKFIFRTTSLE